MLMRRCFAIVAVLATVTLATQAQEKPSLDGSWLLSYGGLPVTQQRLGILKIETEDGKPTVKVVAGSPQKGATPPTFSDLKIDGAGGKQILRSLLYRHVPKALFDRPKAGFAVPIGAWLRGPLRPWAEELLDERRLASEGWFDPRAVRRRWEDHLAQRSDSTAALWSILMFQAWLDRT